MDKIHITPDDIALLQVIEKDIHREWDETQTKKNALKVINKLISYHSANCFQNGNSSKEAEEAIKAWVRKKTGLWFNWKAEEVIELFASLPKKAQEPKLHEIKFTGMCMNSGKIVTGDLVRKGSRSGGHYHYIYVDGDIEDKGVYYEVDAATVKQTFGGAAS